MQLRSVQAIVRLKLAAGRDRDLLDIQALRKQAPHQ
jgi:hypothetical protein